MKNLFIIAGFMIICSFSGHSQHLEDTGRIALNIHLSEELDLPSEARQHLNNKLKSIATNYGMGGTAMDPRFILTANISALSKDVIPGAPSMIAQKLEVTYFIGDALENKIFSNTSVVVRGVGTNETKSFINALNKLQPRSKTLESFVEEAKSEILAYYEGRCEIMIKEATSLAAQQKYEQALYQLQLIPEIVVDCYEKALDTSEQVFTGKINAEGKHLLEEAKVLWAAQPDAQGARKALPYLLKINKAAACYPEVAELSQKVEQKLIQDEEELSKIKEENAKRTHELALENARNQAERSRLRINAFREIALSFFNKQPEPRYNVLW